MLRIAMIVGLVVLGLGLIILLGQARDGGPSGEAATRSLPPAGPGQRLGTSALSHGGPTPAERPWAPRPPDSLPEAAAGMP